MFTVFEGRGGGVGIVFAKFIKVGKVFHERYSNFDCIGITVTHGNKTFTIFTIYRPDRNNTTFFEEFEDFLIYFESKCTNIMYIGDFNFRINNVDDANTQRFLNIIDNFNLKNVIESPTCYTGNTNDFLLTKSEYSFINNVEVCPVTTISDHHIMTFNFDIICVKKMTPEGNW